LGQKNPVVGLLSIGGEELKGNDVTKRTLQRLRQNKLLNFRGNIEGHDVFEGEVDVCVCDGFVGNVLLKSVESLAKAISHWIKREFKANLLRIFGAICLKGALKNLKTRMNPDVYGGAPLLGVNGTVIITHGASSHKAIYHAIHVSVNAVQNKISEKITQNLSQLAEQKAAQNKEEETNV
jgi:glycerol-3-phosphate acyltransferase PlsX